MREIKFRGKRLDNCEWVYGCLCCIDNEPVIVEGSMKWVDGSELYCNTFYFIIPESDGQYTGLKDKNGNELWESDIIENEHKERYLIVWDGTGFRAALNGSKKAIYSANEYWFKSCEKIGNKWDNPELLKEVE